MLLKQFNNNIVAGTNLKVAIPVIAMWLLILINY